MNIMRIAEIRYTYVLVLLLIGSSTVNAQFLDPRAAKEHFNHRNYKAAIPLFKKLLQKEKLHVEYNHKLGICYLKSNIDKTAAIKYLERVVARPKFDNEALFDLALGYQYANRFDDAIEMYTKYKGVAGGKNLDKVDRKLETCVTAKKLIRDPIDVRFENLGPSINSKYPDYYPFVAKDESYIAFTSRRGGALEFDGFYQSDIYVSEGSGDKYLKAQKGNDLINSAYDDQAVGLSDDATTLFVYFDNIKEVGDIYTSTRAGRRFSEISKLGVNVNSSSLETSASVSADGNTLFFTSSRSGGYGGLDLYMTRKLPTGEWALPQNIGNQINTIYNEDFPTLSADGQTLYFCSEGHESMGGYDIFTSTWDPESNSWSAPSNIGYPINTSDDNLTISFTEDGVHAYVSALRPGGFGDLDIYKITFPKEYLIRLQLPGTDPENPLIKDAYVSIEADYFEQPLSFSANQNTGFYTIIIKKPGLYTLYVEADGYKVHTEVINFDNDNYTELITFKIIKLIPN